MLNRSAVHTECMHLVLTSLGVWVQVRFGNGGVLKTAVVTNCTVSQQASIVILGSKDGFNWDYRATVAQGFVEHDLVMTDYGQLFMAARAAGSTTANYHWTGSSDGELHLSCGLFVDPCGCAQVVTRGVLSNQCQAQVLAASVLTTRA